KAAAAFWGWPLRNQLSASSMYISASEPSRSVQACCNCSGLSLVGATSVRTRPRGGNSRDWIDEGGSGEYLTVLGFLGSFPARKTIRCHKPRPAIHTRGIAILTFNTHVSIRSAANSQARR